MAENGSESPGQMDWTDPDLIFMSSDVVTGCQVPARRPRLPKPLYLLTEMLLERIEKQQYEPSPFEPAPTQKLLKHSLGFDWTAFAEKQAAPPFELNPDLSPAHGMDLGPDTPTFLAELDEALSSLQDGPSRNTMPESTSEPFVAFEDNRNIPNPRLVHPMDEDKENSAVLPAENYNEKRLDVVDQTCAEPCKCPAGHNLLERVKALEEQNQVLRVQMEQLQASILKRSRVKRRSGRRI